MLKHAREPPRTCPNHPQIIPRISKNRPKIRPKSIKKSTYVDSFCYINLPWVLEKLVLPS